MTHPDLRELARRAMTQRGFLVDTPPRVLEEVDAQSEREVAKSQVRDLRSWLWSSIDNDESRDLDQIEYATREADGIRVYVGIADVDQYVYRGSLTDEAARHNTTSVYTGVLTFPMLPERLSTGLTSLNEGEDRLAMIVEMLVTDHGRVAESAIYAALVRNKAQLTYNSVASWLESGGELQASVELEEQLRLQDQAAQSLRKGRHEAGALTFHSADLRPVISKDGVVMNLDVRRQNRASWLIEDLMIASNETVATFLDAHASPSLRREVKTPERWDRIMIVAASLGHTLPDQPDVKSLQQFLDAQRQTNPSHFDDISLAIVKLMGRGEYVARSPGDSAAGHFALAASAYSHSTAPNRRFADLVTQRLLKAVLAKSLAPYSLTDLNTLAVHCTEREDAANKVERYVKKCAAAVLLIDRIGQQFDGVISGATDRGTWVRLSHPPLEGKVVRARHDVDVGDRVRVRLTFVDVERGFIDFELV
jgi:VacB/RNase II family 3'-5' exoribonuclease